jgi:hypothetical protein
MSEYDQAQICINGHLVNGRSNTCPTLNKDFCGRCGAKTVTACPACTAPIPGNLLSESGNVQELAPDEFCHKCGKSFPWKRDAGWISTVSLLHSQMMATMH